MKVGLMCIRAWSLENDQGRQLGWEGLVSIMTKVRCWLFYVEVANMCGLKLDGEG